MKSVQLIFKAIAILGLVITVGSCATHPANTVASPAPGAFKLRPYQEITLENGLRLLLVEDHALPRISLGLLVMTGTLQESPGKFGLNHFTIDLLEQGTTHRTATQVADDFGQIASDLNFSGAGDSTLITASALTTDKERLLELFADVILHPAFDNKEIERDRAQTLATISRQSDNPSGFADQLIDKENFGIHPYAHPLVGDMASVRSFTRSDLLSHYSRFYVPNNSIMYVAGSFDSSYVDKVKKAFSGWQKKAIDEKIAYPVINKSAEAIVLYSKPDLQQAQIRFAERGIRRSDPDFMLLRIANLILGGDFVSRLNLRVRDDLGLTYSIHSSSSARLDVGSFDISTFSRNEKTAEIIKETRDVVKKFVQQGATQSELDAAKALLAGQFPAAIETTDKLANNLVLLRAYGVNDSYLHDFVKNLDGITLSQVNEVIRKRIHPDQLITVVYADEKMVQDQLKSLGPVRVENVVIEK